MNPILICLLGAVAGGIVGFVCARIFLPVVLRAQGSRTRNGKIAIGVPAPEFLKDADHVAALTTAAYRYVFPVVFAVVGANAAYHFFVESVR